MTTLKFPELPDDWRWKISNSLVGPVLKLQHKGRLFWSTPLMYSYPINPYIYARDPQGAIDWAAEAVLGTKRDFENIRSKPRAYPKPGVYS